MEEQDDLTNDPLLRPGTFIDPNPISNGSSKPKISTRIPNPDPKGPTVDPKSPPNGVPGFGSDQTPDSARPDWLPPNWTFVERVRTSGATAGTRDKYFYDPVTNRRFRSKKEVFAYLESGEVRLHHRKNANSDGDGTPLKNTKPKRKKGEAERDITKYFNFDDVPAKIKWELTDVYEGDWRPLLNGIERVPETSKQDWVAAFTYLALQNSGR